MKPNVVLFLCTGNYYRSRFSELRSITSQRNLILTGGPSRAALRLSWGRTMSGRSPEIR